MVKLHVTEESKGEKWKINYKLSVSEKISKQNFIAAMKFKTYMIGGNHQSNAFCIMARHGNGTGFAFPILAPYSPKPPLPSLGIRETCSIPTPYFPPFSILVCPCHWFYREKNAFSYKISMTQAVQHQLQTCKI